MNVVRNSVKNGLAAAALVVACSAQVSLAGYTAVLSNNVGQVSANLGYTPSGTNKASTKFQVTNPSAGVTTAGSFIAQTNQPSGTPTVCTSTVSTVFLVGGYKAVAHSYCAPGVNADASDEFKQKLKDEQFMLVPNPCGSSYTIASGVETNNGQRNLVVLGNATAGMAAWLRGYFFAGTPTDETNLTQIGVKLFDLVIQGPFDFGDINSTDRCNALKIPIYYLGPNLYIVTDGAAYSGDPLALTNCPSSVTFGCTDKLAYPANITTTGGCGATNITFSPPASVLGPGSNLVTAIATDAAGNGATCQFTAFRPFLTLGTNGFANPINGSGGSCTAPIRTVNGAGNKIQIKFSTYLCNTLYTLTTPPTVTITKLYDPSVLPPLVPCTPSQVEINQQKLASTSNTWHWQWQTLPTDVGYFLISVNLGDGNPNPLDPNISAIIQLTP